MKTLFKRIEKNDKQLDDVFQAIKIIKESEYYSQDSTEGQREKDMERAKSEYRKIINERLIALESLQLEINKEMHRISTVLKYENSSI